MFGQWFYFTCEAHKSPSNTHWTVKSPGRLDISHRRNHICIQESRVLLERSGIFISCYHVFLKSPHYTVGPLSEAKTNWMDKGLQDQVFWQERETVTNPWTAVLSRWLSLYKHTKFTAGTELAHSYRTYPKETLSATWTLLRCSLLPKPPKRFIVWSPMSHPMRTSNVPFSWRGSPEGTAGCTVPS